MVKGGNSIMGRKSSLEGEEARNGLIVGVGMEDLVAI